MRIPTLTVLLCLAPLTAFSQDLSLTALQEKWATSSKRDANALVVSALNKATIDKPLLNWVLQQDPDRIEDLADDAVEDYPQSAQLWYLRGRIHAIQAQNSVFSAMSHASDSLASFEQAASLQPQEIVYQNGLFGFYQGAPSIAGGDNDKAAKVARDIIKIDPRQGYYQLVSLGYNKDLDEKASWIDEAQVTLGDLPDFSFLEGISLQSKEQYEQSSAAFQRAASTPLEDEKSQEFKLLSLYQIGRNAVLDERYSTQAQRAFEAYLAVSPEQDGMPEAKWAKLRLAQLHAINKDKGAAQDLLASIDVSDDENLEDEVKKLKKRIKKMR